MVKRYQLPLSEPSFLNPSSSSEPNACQQHVLLEVGWVLPSISFDHLQVGQTYLENQGNLTWSPYYLHKEIQSCWVPLPFKERTTISCINLLCKLNENIMLPGVCPCKLGSREIKHEFLNVLRIYPLKKKPSLFFSLLKQERESV